MDLGLNGVHVLVTGASGGIGLEIVRNFLQQGAKVTAHFNTTHETLQPITEAFNRGNVQTKQANLTKEDQVAMLFDNAAKSFGPVQIIIVNHGIWPTEEKPLQNMSLEQWKSTLDVNLTSSFLVAREYLRHLERAADELKAHANIVFIGSTAGKYGEADHADYAASKSALMYGLTLSLKNEIVKIAPLGRVNCVAPGWVRTPMAEEALKNPVIVYRSLATTPLKKFSTPLDIAMQVIMLSSKVVSGNVTGQVIMVEGGMEGRLLNLQDVV